MYLRSDTIKNTLIAINYAQHQDKYTPCGYINISIPIHNIYLTTQQQCCSKSFA